RAWSVTGVQTCALPISWRARLRPPLVSWAQSRVVALERPGIVWFSPLKVSGRTHARSVGRAPVGESKYRAVDKRGYADIGGAHQHSHAGEQPAQRVSS